MGHRQLPHDSPWLLALLAALVALGPLSVDMYLPAMPIMMRAFDTDISHMHLTLSSYLAGFALFHLACGPLADRFGRKPVLISGTLLFVAACIGCSLANTVEQMLAFRFLQGVGACVGPTLARAVARDVFGPTDAARALSLIAMLMALAPAVAPTLGGALLLVLPWESVFIFLAAYGAVMIALIRVFLAESLPQAQSLHPLTIARNYGELLVDPFFLTVTVSSGLVYAGLMVYLASSSFVYIEMLGVPVEYFGLVFLSSVVGYMGGSAFSARLSKRRDSEQIMRLGVMLGMAACCLLWVSATLWPASVLALVLPMSLYSIAMGLVLPHAMAIALRPFPHIAGTASSLLGFIQMSLSAAASALIGGFLSDSPLPMIHLLLGISLVALLLGLRVHRLYLRAGP
ncbi:MAG: multidrug effflux MFS transporter [Pseudomonadales bacterium]|nr:multidrug effflux MFS transporter [Halieaceae bacterium]MCP5163649.1 multidrug effflux MFS transporter [Pseudomonadales bacterium]MCP5189273.1 multidrug effflux MFS transporter [Pseudomonadales bacterium]MCP5204467.1 multidrug effflux MFS transporter [Pseudomonadales bacterium]